MDSLDRMLANVDGVTDQLEEPYHHFQRNRDRYLSIARQITQQTLKHIQPPEADDEDWQRYSDHFINAITAIGLTHGIKIRYSGSRETQGSNAATEDEITMADVREWVEAGIAGDPDGKDITEVDHNDAGEINTERTVRLLYHGMSDSYSGVGEFDGIRKRVTEWIESNTGTSFQEFLPTILEAWEAGLTPIIEQDYDKYVDGVLRSL